MNLNNIMWKYSRTITHPQTPTLAHTHTHFVWPGGQAVSMLAFHRCGPGSIPGCGHSTFFGEGLSVHCLEYN